MAELYVGNLDPNITTREIEHEFQPYGDLRTVKIPRTSSRRRYAFVEFDNRRDALFAIHSWNGKFSWRVELSRNSISVQGDDCYSCGGSGHFARDCNSTRSKDIKNKGVQQSQGGRTKKNQVASTSIWKPVPPPPPPWVELPEDITVKILHKLGPVELLATAQKVCTAWRKICRDPIMWRVIDLWKLADVDGINKLRYDGHEVLCRLAIDLSQGQVTEINIEEFGYNSYDNLLVYIAERCGKLRCLRFAFCDGLSFATLSKTKGFPLLEELHLQCTRVKRADIEAIAQSCPMLKTLALNAHQRSEEALAIATFMPELHHLQLIGNAINNDTLEAILNGCPKLESLDLRQCFCLNLEGELGKRCAQQIKILRHPYDPTHDYEWYTRTPYWLHEHFCDQGSYGDYDYDDFEYDDFCDPFQFDGGDEDSLFEGYLL